MFDEALFRFIIMRRGEKISDAAKVMGISQVTLYRKMQGISDFYRTEIQKFCNHYKVQAENIFFANTLS